MTLAASNQGTGANLSQEAFISHECRVSYAKEWLLASVASLLNSFIEVT